MTTLFATCAAITQSPMADLFSLSLFLWVAAAVMAFKKFNKPQKRCSLIRRFRP